MVKKKGHSMGMMQTVFMIVVTQEEGGRDDIGEPKLLTGTFNFFSEREI